MASIVTLLGPLSTNDSYESQMANFGNQVPTYTQAKTLITRVASFLGKEIVGDGYLVAGGIQDGMTQVDNEIYIGIVYFQPYSSPFELSCELATGGGGINNQENTNPSQLTTGIIPFIYFRGVAVTGSMFAFFYGYKFTLQNV